MNASIETNVPGAVRCEDGLGITSPWTENDPRMWREQCRVGDVAFQHLFVTTRGMPVPDWVKDGLPNMYRLLEHIALLEDANRRANAAIGDIANECAAIAARVMPND